MNQGNLEQRASGAPAESAVSFLSQALPIFFLTGIFFLNFISRIIPAPLMPAIETDLRVSHGEAGTLFLFISMGYCAALIGSGFVSARLTHRRAIVLSSLAVGVSLLGVSASRGPWEMRAGMLLLGMGAGIYLPSGIATLTSLVQARHWGKAVAIHELAPNLSFIAAPLLSEALLLILPWRGVFGSLGGAAILVGIVYARFGKGGGFQGSPPSLASCKKLFSDPAFRIMMILFSLGISASVGIYTMLPLYLVNERGIDLNWANTLLALSRIAGPAMGIFGGLLADRFGPKRTISGVFFATGLMTILLGTLHGHWVAAAIFLQPMAAVSFFPAGFAALSSIGPSDMRNVAVSLTFPFAFLIGGGVVPTVIGIMGDAGSFALGISIVGVLILTGAVLSSRLRPSAA